MRKEGGREIGRDEREGERGKWKGEIKIIILWGRREQKEFKGCVDD